MRVLIVGAGGTVGQAAATALKKHEIIAAGRKSGAVKVDMTDAKSITAMFAEVGQVDAVVCCAGHGHFGPLATMTGDQFMSGLKDKLMGQVNLVLIGTKHVNDGGSFTLIGGILNRDPIRMGANAAAINGAIDAFVRSAAIELPRGIRINAVSPGLLEESVERYDGYFPGHEPVPSARVGRAFAKSVEGGITGQVIEVG